jgi:photosystem I P700 chlorophyll a apoprotein A2
MLQILNHPQTHPGQNWALVTLASLTPSATRCTSNSAWHWHRGLSLASVVTRLLAATNASYAFYCWDFLLAAALYTHHQYIAGFLMVWCVLLSRCYFFVRTIEANKNNVLACVLNHKEAIISHLGWYPLFLGFPHAGLCTFTTIFVVAFGTPEKQILVRHIFAQWVQSGVR